MSMRIQARTVAQWVAVILVVPLLPLLLSGRWNWWQAWAYAAVNILGFGLSRGLAARRHPDLIAERARFTDHEGVAEWDKVLAPLIGLGGGAVPLVAGLDARYGWSTAFPSPMGAAALAGLLFGYGLAAYALVENRFFSGVVRIPTDRGHRVVSSGPYRWIRHPSYAGALLAYLATPALLDSGWAFVPAAVLSALLILRTQLEDRTLQAALPGYREYAKRVVYRILPGVW